MQCYFRAVLTDVQPIIAAATIEMTGTMNRSATAEQWKPFTSRQRVVTRNPGFLWDMQTADFAANLVSLIELARWDRVALMCAEAVPWRCHRSLIADALVVHGASPCESVSPTRLRPHKLTPFACVRGTEITYPPAASVTSANPVA